MKKFIFALSFALLMLSNFIYSQKYTAFKNVNIFIPTTGKVINNAVLIVKDSLIYSYGQLNKIKIPDNADTFNLKGKWIIPGLIDAHIHFFQSGGLYTRPDIIDLQKVIPYKQEMDNVKGNIDNVLLRYVKCGVTGIVDMGGPFWNFEVREKCSINRTYPLTTVCGPLLSSYYPKNLDSIDKPIIKVNNFEEIDYEINKQLQANTDFIKIWYIVRKGETPETHLPLIKHIIDKSHNANKKVIVHATEHNTALAAIEAGADILAHSISDSLISPKLLKLLKDRKVIYVPTLLVSQRYEEVFSRQLNLSSEELLLGDYNIIKSLSDLWEIPDSLIPEKRKYWLPEQRPVKEQIIAMQNLKLLHDNGIHIATGTDAGNIGTLHGSSIFKEMQMMEKAGIPITDIIKYTTSNSGMLINQPNYGSFSKNTPASFIILNNNPLLDIKNIADINLVVNRGIIINPDSLLLSDNIGVIQQQVNAYNARNIDVFMSYFADDIVIKDLVTDKINATSNTEMRPMYIKLFNNTKTLHCKIVNRMTVGNYVMDREYVTGFPNNRTAEAVAIYLLKDGKIKTCSFLR
ncbi:MAG: hypothetical protein A2X12_10400 [Bacteroidetes bacterium GWE2_29_8]|nr:MAG: hypothetical protein A2X12_10400 [Bacteroidetes bacterium GWE2_29_8]OFY16627.1 MAG: hypothetical protein A2X02_05670 [Bacteroidetes bacterium GWF2_29_10]